MNSPLLFLSAGDPSGDNAAGRMLRCLREIRPTLSCFGLGGPRLTGHGQRQLADPADLAVMGFWEVARRYGFFRRLMQRCVAEIAELRPSAIVMVDYPGFNLRLAKRVKHLGIPIIYYISPQVWAWGKKRVREIRQLVDRMLVILPFETEFFRGHDVPCDFVGHYLIEHIPDEYIASEPPGSNRLALLPGSRPQEIARMLPPMLEAARQLVRERNMTAVVAGISGAYDYERLLRGAPEVELVLDHSYRVLFESDIALVTSGTATLETGLVGRPMVVAYKTGWLTYQIARRLITLDHIALVNLVLQGSVVPELIQHDAAPERFVGEVERYLDDPGRYDAVRAKLNELLGALGGAGASQRAAEIIGGYL